MLDRTAEAFEMMILGACINENPLAMADAAAMLIPSDFYLRSHQQVFAALLNLHSQGKEINLLWLRAELERTRELDSVGGCGYLARLTTGVPRKANIQENARVVIEHSQARQAGVACETALQRLQGASESVSEVLADLRRELDREQPQESMSAAAVVPSALAFLDEVPEVFSTGIHLLDEATAGGIRPKELWVVGAWPSGGKSALLRQMERGLMPYGVHTHSIEIPGDRWERWHIARTAGLEAWKVREISFISEAERESMRQAGMRVAKWNHFIDDDGEPTVEAIVARSRLTAMRHGTRVHTVDFLQLMAGRAKSEQENIAHNIRALKAFAKKENCAVIVLSQLTELRGTGEGDTRPIIKNLRGAGEIRQVADVVLLLHRPKDGEVHTGFDEIIIAKQRDGTIGTLSVRYNAKTLEFDARETRC